MKRITATAITVITLGFAPLAASAETVGIGDDTVKIFTSQAAGPVPVEATRSPRDGSGFDLVNPFDRDPGVFGEMAREREQRLIENGPTYR